MVLRGLTCKCSCTVSHLLGRCLSCRCPLLPQGFRQLKVAQGLKFMTCFIEYDDIPSATAMYTANQVGTLAGMVDGWLGTLAGSVTLLPCALPHALFPARPSPTPSIPCVLLPCTASYAPFPHALFPVHPPSCTSPHAPLPHALLPLHPFSCTLPHALFLLHSYPCTIFHAPLPVHPSPYTLTHAFSPMRRSSCIFSYALFPMH